MVRRCSLSQGGIASLVLFMFALHTVGPLFGEPPKMLRMFGKQGNQSTEEKPYALTELEGPWMILAATFAGPTGQAQATALAKEFRESYDLPAFIHEENFDFSQPLQTTGQETRRMRYANDQSYQAYAVLVGEYDSVNHPDLLKTLDKIKTATPRAYDLEGNDQDNSPLAAVRDLHRKWIGMKKNGPKGPMANAFATRNPILPEDFFAPPEVDSFVYGLNKEVEHSLLDNPGKFTVVVRTFEGLSTFVDGKHDKEFHPSGDRLNRFAEQAHTLVTQLRKEGVEAWEFHDRSRSLVTVGSFDSLGQETADGGFRYSAEIERTMKEYSAGTQYERGPDGRMTIAANHRWSIPFDVKPAPIAVPKRSKRSFYTAAFGLGKD